MNAVLDTLDFDPDALRAKYQAERDRRLRADGNDQYVEVAADFAHYIDDPYVEPGFTRAPLNDTVDVVVVGGGFGGLIAAARLREAGVQDIRIIEKGGDFGGTWYWNRYPGAQCDIEAYIYLPLLEETGYIPKEKYSFAAEIREHAHRIGEHFDLYAKACFQTEIREMRWLEDEARWLITTNRDDAMKARYVVMSSGPLNRPKLPGIRGIADFKGHAFHTSRWDYAYTGGDSTGGLTKLADKRVAIIGTGATAIQCVPHLGAGAKQLYVFQRTPSSIDVRNNKATDPEWVKTLTPGWQKRRMRNFNTLVSGLPQDEDLVSDGWTDIIRNLASGVAARMAAGDATALQPEELARQMELSDFKKMNQIRARVDETVQDAATAEALKPWYRQFCKRPTFNDEYLPAFNRPNVTLVDVSEAKGVERITPKGVVANGVEYPVDCIIYASGFEISTAFRRRIGFEIVGRDGLSLYDYYRDGFRTLHGHSSRNFPNWFYIGIGQNGLSVNMTAMFDDQARHISYIIQQVRERGAVAVEPTAEAEEAWVETIRSVAVLNRDFQNACTPGYYNNEGGERSGGLNGQTYTPGINRFNALLAEWREQGDLNGLQLHYA
jgi:cyclohexanone monooxygenase